MTGGSGDEYFAQKLPGGGRGTVPRGGVMRRGVGLLSMVESRSGWCEALGATMNNF